jgi:hypothetical protein
VTATVRLADPAATAKPQRAIAASRFHFTDPHNPDLLWVNFVLDAEGPNNNWDYMPRASLVQNYATAAYKPLDMDHVIEEDQSMVYMDKKCPPVKNTIYGVMAKASLADADGNVLTGEAIAELDNTDMFRKDDDKLRVIAWAAMYRFLFPSTVEDVTKAIATGDMKVSMERWISKFDFLQWDVEKEQYKAVAREIAVDDGTFDNWARHQSMYGKPVYRRALSFVYGGVASTSNPAQKLSHFIGQTSIKATADNRPVSPVLKNLKDRHDELHRLYTVSLDDDQKAVLVLEHEMLTKAIAALT